MHQKHQQTGAVVLLVCLFVSAELAHVFEMGKNEEKSSLTLLHLASTFGTSSLTETM